MTKFLFLVLLAVAFFLAGMFLYLPFLALFVAMLLLALFCLITSRYFRRHVTVAFCKRSETTQIHEKLSGQLLIRYTGSLPTGTIKVPVKAAYVKGRKHRLATVRQAVEKKGDQQVAFPVQAPSCGLMTISFPWFRTNDYLTLFRPKKRKSDAMELAVFPGEEALDVEFSETGEDESNQPESQLINRAGDASQEIRQLREYQEGDPTRQIHWNLSARMDDLWIKEFQRESDRSAVVLLDGRGFSACSAADAGCFYELISALALGLLNQVSGVTLCWQEPEKNGLHTEEVLDIDQLRDALLLLYRRGLAEKLPAGTEDKGVFQVDPSLKVCWNGQILHQFSRKNLEEEISREVLSV